MIQMLLIQHSLWCLHYVPAAAVVHVWPFLRLLTETHHLIGTFAVKVSHESLRRPWPVTVRVTPMPVVTVVTLQHTQTCSGEKQSWWPAKQILKEKHSERMPSFKNSVELTLNAHLQTQQWQVRKRPKSWESPRCILGVFELKQLKMRWAWSKCLHYYA